MPQRIHKLMPLEEMRLIVRFDRTAGLFYWRDRPPEDFQNKRAWRASHSKRRPGTAALNSPLSSGYLKSIINGVTYCAHVVAWAFENGEWPTKQIDHIDGNVANNRPENLRHVSGPENQRNAKRPTHNTSGVVGVCWHKGANKWMAQIQVNKRAIYLGLFDTIEEAAAARLEASHAHGFHPNHGRIVDRKGGWEKFKQRAVSDRRAA